MPVAWRDRFAGSLSLFALAAVVVGFADADLEPPTVKGPHGLAGLPAIVQTTTPVLAVENTGQSGEHRTYRFEVASDPLFETLVSDSGALPNTSTFTVPEGRLDDGKTYYWRARVGRGGSSSAPSIASSFTIAANKLGLREHYPLWSSGALSINLATGNLIIALPGPSYPSALGTMSVGIVYNSRGATDVTNGFTKQFTLSAGDLSADPPLTLIDHSTETGGQDNVERKYADGSVRFYSHVGGSNTYTPEAGDNARLARNADGSFVLYDRDGSVYTYSNQPEPGTGGGTGKAAVYDLLSASVQGDDPVPAFNYSFAQGLLTEVQDAVVTARKLTLSWNSLNPSSCSDAILCVVGPDGVRWRYVGDANGGTTGRLTRVWRADRAVAGVDFNGIGQVDRVWGPNDLSTVNRSPGYDPTHTIAINQNDKYEPIGITESGVTGQAVSTTATWQFVYQHEAWVSTPAARASHPSDPSGRLAEGWARVTTPNGASTYVYWNSSNQLIGSQDPAGNWRLSSWNNRNQPVWAEDEQGNPTDSAWDTVDETLTSVTGPDPNIAGLSRPVTAYRYDESVIGTAATPGAPLQGMQAAYYRNPSLVGRPDVRATANPTQSWGTSAPAAIPDRPDDFSIRYTGNLVVPTAGSYTFETVVADDEDVRLTIDGVNAIAAWPASNTTNTSQPISLTAGKHKLVLEYHEKNQSASLQLSWACAACSPVLAKTVVPLSALLPAWGNQTSVVSPSGRLSFSHFDRPEFPLPDYTLNKLADGTNVITSFDYDSYGRTIKKVMPRGNAARTIDAAGFLTGQPESTGAFATTYDYYAATATAATSALCTPSETVNQSGLLKLIRRGVQGVPGALADEVYVYDGAGRLSSLTNGHGVTGRCYNPQGLVSRSKASGEVQETVYTYAPAGAPRTISDATGTVTNEYDEAGRLKRSIDSYGAEAAFIYDRNGNPVSRTIAVGPLASSTGYTTSYTYDAQNRLTGLTDPASRAYSFLYDSRGVLRGTRYPNGTFSWQDVNATGWLTNLYNRHGTLTTVAAGPPADANPLVDFSYTYDQDGRKLTERRALSGSALALTASGNEITDAVRNAGVQGDGRATPDSSFGIWAPTTNQLTGVEAYIGGTIVQDATSAKFGGSSTRATAPSWGDGLWFGSPTNQSIGSSVTVSASVWLKGSGTVNVFARLDGSSTKEGPISSVTLTSTWQRVEVSVTGPSSWTANEIRLFVRSTSSSLITFWADGAQAELQTTWTPFVTRDSGSGLRGPARVQMPSSLVNASQGWFAFRLRMGFDSPNAPGGLAYLFNWRESSSSQPMLAAAYQDGKFKLYSRVSSLEQAEAPASFTHGDTATVVVAWTASELKVSVNGSAFATVARSAIPNLASIATIDLGSDDQGTSHWANSDFLWAAAGTGTLSNADAATFHGYGNTDPTSTPGTSTFIWPANTTSVPGGPEPETTSYAYDQLGRLETVAFQDGTSRRYCFDLDSNRSEITAASATTCGSPNPVASYSYGGAGVPGLGRLLSVTEGGQTRTFSYSADGETTSYGDKTLTWDGRGRHSGGTFAGQGVAYGFDPVGFRRERTDGSSVVRYLHGGSLQTTASGVLTLSDVDGPAGDIAQYAGPPTTSTPVTFIYHTGHGDVAATADHAGVRTASHTYDPYGATSNEAAEGWVGRWDKKFDVQSDLIEMGARPYDPALGRFLALDPIEGGALNSYDYSGQDPINGYDLDGQLCKICKQLASNAKKAVVKAASWAASKAVEVSAGIVLGVKAVASKQVAIYGGGVATMAVAVQTLSPVATTITGGVAAGVAQAVTDAFSSMPTTTRLGRAAVASLIGAAAVSAGAAAALVCGGCGIVVAIALNYAGQKYVGSYVNGQFGWTTEP